ncbi:MAG: iron ABC transporter permease [Oscillospiraceae bacterium]|nr:iron ABC transporter permease [Oscillospiraceae bacterium]
MKLSDSKQKELNARIRINMEQEQNNLYGNQEKQRHSLGREKRNTILLGVALLVIFLLSCIFLTIVVDSNYSLAWAARQVILRVNDITDLILGNHLQSGIQYFLCQIATAVVAGAALAVAGVSFQGVFHNPMASPTLLGVESGGAMGTMVFVLFFYQPMLTPFLNNSVSEFSAYALEYNNMNLIQKYGQYLFTFGGCVAVVVIVMLIAKLSGKGKIETVPLMVGGTIFTMSINSILELVQYYLSISGANPALTEQIESLQTGRYNSLQEPVLLLGFLIPVLAAIIFTTAMGGRLNIIAFGEQEAKLMGVNVGLDRTVLVMLSTILTAAVVAFCGTIAFVGMIVPHFARMIVGSNFRLLVPASAFLGGIFMLLAYDIYYMTNMVVNVGHVVNIAGGLIFAVFMFRYRRRGNADWA